MGDAAQQELDNIVEFMLVKESMSKSSLCCQARRWAGMEEC